MKILICSEFFKPNVGGVEIHSEVLANYLSKNHKVNVATTFLNRTSKELKKKIAINEFKIKGSLVKGYSGEIKNYENFLLNSDFDIIFFNAAQQWTFDLALPILDKIKSKKIFFPCGFSRLNNFFFKPYFEILKIKLNYFDEIVCCSKNWKDYKFCKKYFKKKINIISNGSFSLKNKKQKKNLVIKYVSVSNLKYLKGQDRIIDIFKTLWRLGDIPPMLFFKIFDTQIKPILLYGSEVWGFYPNAQLERAQLFALKRLLNVSPYTPNDMVYGETGRYPLYIDAYLRCISYWLRLVRMDSTRLPYKAYHMLLNMSKNGTRCWVNLVQETLYRYGYGYIWENQGVQHKRWFLRVFRQRLVDCFHQGWHEHVSQSGRFSVYMTFKTSVSLESYFVSIHNKHLRDLVIKFRLGIFDIRVNEHRYTDSTDFSCPLCGFNVEDELHFIFQCPKLDSIRAKYIPDVSSFPVIIESLRCILYDDENLEIEILEGTCTTVKFQDLNHWIQ